MGVDRAGEILGAAAVAQVGDDFADALARTAAENLRAEQAVGSGVGVLREGFDAVASLSSPAQFSPLARPIAPPPVTTNFFDMATEAMAASGGRIERVPAKPCPGDEAVLICSYSWCPVGGRRDPARILLRSFLVFHLQSTRRRVCRVLLHFGAMLSAVLFGACASRTKELPRIPVETEIYAFASIQRENSDGITVYWKAAVQDDSLVFVCGGIGVPERDRVVAIARPMGGGSTWAEVPQSAVIIADNMRVLVSDAGPTRDAGALPIPTDWQSLYSSSLFFMLPKAVPKRAINEGHRDVFLAVNIHRQDLLNFSAKRGSVCHSFRVVVQIPAYGVRSSGGSFERCGIIELVVPEIQVAPDGGLSVVPPPADGPALDFLGEEPGPGPTDQTRQ